MVQRSGNITIVKFKQTNQGVALTFKIDINSSKKIITGSKIRDEQRLKTIKWVNLKNINSLMPKRDSEFKNPEIRRTTAETKTNWKRSVKAAIIAFESASVS